ncbi:MAG: hypothetical protein ACM3JG_16480 [Thiohalocapsa sp.]
MRATFTAIQIAQRELRRNLRVETDAGFAKASNSAGFSFKPVWHGG